MTKALRWFPTALILMVTIQGTYQRGFAQGAANLSGVIKDSSTLKQGRNR